jgi:heterodisulfide reductase subunit A-like polyferredoxin
MHLIITLTISILTISKQTLTHTHKGGGRQMNARGQQLPVLVAGGGIGGLAAALALVRQGFAVKVLEQAPHTTTSW